MSTYDWLYLAMALATFGADILAGEAAGSKPRPLGSLFAAMVWPLALPLALVASGALVGALRKQIGERP